MFVRQSLSMRSGNSSAVQIAPHVIRETFELASDATCRGWCARSRYPGFRCVSIDRRITNSAPLGRYQKLTLERVSINHTGMA